MSTYGLVTKSELNWLSNKSGDLNRLNTFCLFETDNEYGFPEVSSTPDFDPTELILFNMCRKKLTGDKDKAVSFFLDDYKIEPLWSNPRRYTELLRFYSGMISPTFSVWENQPYALNLFNIYRSRWCTRFYQEHGVPVLVDVRWAGKETYDFCFSGIKKKSSVIVNTVGTYKRDNRELFIEGFEPMMKALEPESLYVYGEYYPLDFNKYADSVKYVPSYWKERREHLGTNV